MVRLSGKALSSLWGRILGARDGKHMIWYHMTVEHKCSLRVKYCIERQLQLSLNYLGSPYHAVFDLQLRLS